MSLASTRLLQLIRNFTRPSPFPAGPIFRPRFHASGPHASLPPALPSASPAPTAIHRAPQAACLSLSVLPLLAALALVLGLPGPVSAAPKRLAEARAYYNGDRDDKPPAAEVARERLGLSVQSVDGELADALGLKSDRGALVTAVLPGGPGREAGLERGDVILEVDDALVRDVEGLAEAFAGIKPGREADLTLKRGIKTLEVTLTPRGMAAVSRWENGERERPRGERLGIRVAEPDRVLRRRYGIGSGDGVVVVGVSEGSRAEAAGLREGDFIAEADRRPIRTAGDLLDAVARGRKRGKMVLFIRRGDDALYIPIRFD